MPSKLRNIGPRLGALKPRLSGGKIADELYRSAEWRALAGAVKTAGGGRCSACGSDERVVADHVVEVKDGGRNDAGNLQLLCHACHQAKTAAARAARTRGG